MQIAARWVGWCGLTLGAAAAVAALYARHDATTAVPENLPVVPADHESWRELTYRTFVMGLECRRTPEENARARIENEEALADCLDAWEGSFAVHAIPEAPESTDVRMILVEEESPLGECMRLRDQRDVAFCQSSWARPPADAHRNVPLRLGEARPNRGDAFRRDRERQAAGIADGEMIALACPAQPEQTFVGLPSRRLRKALSQCKSDRDHGWIRIALDETGTVSRVITTPKHVLDVPCALAEACGLRFAGLGTGLTF